MKLRNKKTGEIIEVESLVVNTDGAIQMTYMDEECNRELYITGYLKTFANEFEDYEEPKEYWAIDCFSPDGELVSQFGKCSERIIENRKQIGNYFETKEEAEKAVEKFKAWKRLKDKGFKVDLWDYDGGNYQERIKTGRILFRVKDYEENDKDLDLLFGGEK